MEDGGHFQRQPDRQPPRPQRWLATTEAFEKEVMSMSLCAL
jgi:hypothetical protein